MTRKALEIARSRQSLHVEVLLRKSQPLEPPFLNAMLESAKFHLDAGHCTQTPRGGNTSVNCEPSELRVQVPG